MTDGKGREPQIGMTFGISYCTRRGASNNTSYPRTATISNASQLADVVTFDHVVGSFADKQAGGRRIKSCRGIDTFISADGLVLDCDNPGAEDSWISPSDVSATLLGVCFYSVGSRHDGVAKGQESPRPRFHIYFPLAKEVTSASELRSLKERVCRIIPQFDQNAVDAARFIYGVENPSVQYSDGTMCIDEFLATRTSALTTTSISVGGVTDAVIPEGERNSSLHQFATCILKRLGDTAEAYTAFLNRADRCSPPLPESELASIWKSATRFYEEKVLSDPRYLRPEIFACGDLVAADKKPVYDADLQWLKTVDAASNFPCDDRGAGDLLGAFVENRAVFVEEPARWYCYRDGVWQPDVKDLLIQGEAKRLSRALLGYAVSIEDTDLRDLWIKFAQTWKRYAPRCTYIAEARSVRHCSVLRFDADPSLLNVQNGTLDFADPSHAVFREHRPEDMITLICGASYDPLAISALWEHTVSEVFRDNADELEWLQRDVGYSLSGLTTEECCTILWGATTRNGKSTVCETLSRMFGSYASAITPASFDASRQLGGGNVSPDIAKLQGKRWVTVSEPSQQMRMNAALLKSMTGGDKIPARMLYSAEVEFYPQFHLFFNTNVLPAVDDATVFMSDRLHIVEFQRHFSAEERDITLKERLATPQALSGVLNWAIAGREAYAKKRLRECSSMAHRLSAYQYENDKIAQFIADVLRAEAGKRVTCSDVFISYKMWCSASGGCAERRASFLSGLKQHGVQIERCRPSSGGGTTSCVIGWVCVDPRDRDLESA